MKVSTIATMISLMVLMLVSCQPQAISLSVAPVVQQTASALPNHTTTPNPLIVYTATPTHTLTPTITLTPTLTSTPTITLTPSPTPFTGFLSSTLDGAQQSYGQNLFFFTVPGVSQDYTAELGGYALNCSPSYYYVDTLVCYSTGFDLYGDQVISFYEDVQMQKLVHAGTYSVYIYHVVVATAAPTQPAYDIVWAGPNPNCEVRGENQTCEIEYRSYDGVPCVAASCFDSCGWYYSYDTCPYDSDDFEFIAGP